MSFYFCRRHSTIFHSGTLCQSRTSATQSCECGLQRRQNKEGSPWPQQGHCQGCSRVGGLAVDLSLSPEQQGRWHPKVWGPGNHGSSRTLARRILMNVFPQLARTLEKVSLSPWGRPFLPEDGRHLSAWSENETNQKCPVREVCSSADTRRRQGKCKSPPSRPPCPPVEHSNLQPLPTPRGRGGTHGWHETKRAKPAT